MPKRRSHARAVAAGLAGGLAINAVTLAVLLLGAHRSNEQPALATVIQITLDRTIDTEPQEPNKARRTAPHPAGAAPDAPRSKPSNVSPRPSATRASTDDRPQPNPGPPSAQPPASEDRSLEAARAVLRHLRDCARLQDRDAAGLKCGGNREGPEQSISALSEDRKIQFDADAKRQQELLNTNADLQRGLMGTRGNAARYGCAYSGGKWRCGSY